MQIVKIDPNALSAEYGAKMCESLEQGNILVLSAGIFNPTDQDCALLRSSKQSASSAFKNIAYKPHINRTTGVSADAGVDATEVHRILAAYSTGAIDFLARLLPQYAKTWKVDYATFRPLEEQGRDLPLNRRNDLMHVDAFPTRPTHGGRILRLFTNIHPEKDRVWVTSYPFEELVTRYAKEAGLDEVTTAPAALKRSVGRIVRMVSRKDSDRTAYDEFMIRFHTFLKSNEEFQKKGQVDLSHFQPGDTWISFTDAIAHAVKAGQYAVEQTCIVPREAMLLPDLAPLAVLERAAGKPLATR